MKFLISALIALTAVPAWSVSVRNCDITANAKNSYMGGSQPWTKKVFLSTEFQNRVDFNDTILELYLDRQDVIQGSVNHQPKFILKGKASEGSFESAYHTGTIKCSEAVEVTHMFQNKSWKQFYSLDTTINADHILTSMDLRDLKYGLTCFVGDVKAAAADASSFMNAKGIIKSPYEIQYSWTDTVCARGRGSNVDDWTCDEYKQEKRTDSLRHCFLTGQERP